MPTRKHTHLHAQDVAVNDKAHEAGFDAWMTGAVFAHLLSIYQHMQESPNQQPLDVVLPHVGRINVSRSDFPYIALLGEDAVPDRSHVLVLTHLSPGLRVGEVQKALGSAKLGMLGTTRWSGGCCDVVMYCCC